ncbi:MAG: hypothetical protein ACYCT2_03960 [Thermoplasmataceae archaeon]
MNLRENNGKTETDYFLVSKLDEKLVCLRNTTMNRKGNKHKPMGKSFVLPLERACPVIDGEVGMWLAKKKRWQGVE